MIIDLHTHVWPDSVAARALAGAKHNLPHLAPAGDGTVAGLTTSMAAAGVDRSAVFGIGNTAGHVEKANAFVGSLPRDRFIPFGTVHVDLPVEENLASLDRHGIRAVKLHPIFQGIALDDPRLWAIFEAFGSEIACIVHVGGESNPDAAGRCTPPMLVDVVRNFPALKLIACHFGGYEHLEAAREHIIGLPVMVDCSWPPTLAEIPADLLREVILEHGVERVSWGSDWPMADQSAEMAVIRRLGLGDDAETAILGGNVSRLLGLEG